MNNKRFSEVVTYVVILLYISCSLLSNIPSLTSLEYFKVIAKIIRYISYSWFIYQTLVDIYFNRKISILFIIGILLGIGIFIKTGNKIPLIILFMLNSTKNVDFNKLLDYLLYIYIIVYVSVLLLSSVGIIKDIYFYRGEQIRHSFGFLFATDTYSIYLLILLIYYTYVKGKLNFGEVLYLLMPTVFLYATTLGRMSAILSLAVLGISLLRYYYTPQRANEFFKKLLPILPFALLILSILLSVMYQLESPIAIYINNILSNRFYYSSLAFRRYGIPLFGENIEWIGWGSVFDLGKVVNFNYFYVDNSYLKTLFDFGLFFTLYILSVYSMTINEFVRERKKDEYIYLFLILLLFFFVEQHILSIGRNVFLILLSTQFSRFMINLDHKKPIITSAYLKSELNAGPKAKLDIKTILIDEYNVFDNTCTSVKNDYIDNILNRIVTYINCKNPFNHTVILQYPLGKRKIMPVAKNKIIIIHDIDGLRFKDDKQLESEIDYFNKFDYVVAHNKKMKDFLVKQGVTSQIYTNEIFDYLIVGENKQRVSLKNKNVIYAGNIIKAKFYSEIEEENMDFTLNIYSGDKPNTTNSKIKYKGSYDPEVLPSKLEGQLGLVWDGGIGSDDENEPYKNYTKYNMPHKLSCYVAGKIPVIVWSKAGCASFVKKHNIGYLIDNIYDINKLDLSDYLSKRKNVIKLHDQIISGEYTKSVIDNIFIDIERKEKKGYDED